MLVEEFNVGVPDPLLTIELAVITFAAMLALLVMSNTPVEELYEIGPDEFELTAVLALAFEKYKLATPSATSVVVSTTVPVCPLTESTAPPLPPAANPKTLVNVVTSIGAVDGGADENVMTLPDNEYTVLGCNVPANDTIVYSLLCGVGVKVNATVDPSPVKLSTAIDVPVGVTQLKEPEPLVFKSWFAEPPVIVTLPTAPKLAVVVATKLLAVKVVVVLLKVSPAFPAKLLPSLN
jgi:hypothetical protein